MRAAGGHWKEICWAVGLGRAATHEHRLYSFCLIAWRLNGRREPKNVGRRVLIARFRGERSQTVSW